MKRTIAPTMLAMVFATVFVLGILSRAQADEHKDCSNRSLQGSFGFTSTGTLLALAVSAALRLQFACSFSGPPRTKPRSTT